MEIIALIEKIEDIVEESSKIPMSNKVVVDKEEILDLIKDIRIKLPDEIKQASWIKEERQRILSETKNEANTIITDAKYQQESLINDHELTKMAQVKAEEIIESSKNNAYEVKSGTLEYCDDLIKKVQNDLQNIVTTLDENRNELREL